MVVAVRGMRRWSVSSAWVTAEARTSANRGVDPLVVTVMVEPGAAVRARQAVFAPYGDVALPAVDPFDVAEVAAAALTSDGHLERTYVLTGPEATTPRQRTEVIARAIQKDLAFIEASPDDAREQMLQFMPAPVADATLAILGHPTPEEAQVSPDVEKALGRPARSFADWATRNAAAFR